MRKVHHYFVFGFFADALHKELLERLGPPSSVQLPSCTIIGVPSGDNMLPEELMTAMASARTAFMFEGYDFDRAARKRCRARIANAFNEKEIQVEWFNERDLLGVADRNMTLKVSLELVARSICDRAKISPYHSYP